MISGIICEFNPFHAGHKHLIDQVKCHPGDAVVCVMSGNFVQRGTFARPPVWWSDWPLAPNAPICKR